MAEISDELLTALHASCEEALQAEIAVWLYKDSRVTFAVMASILAELQRRRAEARQAPGVKPWQTFSIDDDVTPEPQPAGAVTDEQIARLEETLGALEGKHGEGWINISVEERRLFARLIRQEISALEAAFAARPAAEQSGEVKILLDGLRNGAGVDDTMRLNRLAEIIAVRPAAEPVGAKDILDIAWDCSRWPDWLIAVVDKTAAVSDEHDMSAEQAAAYAALLARSDIVSAPQPSVVEAIARAFAPKMVNASALASLTSKGEGK